MAKLDIKYEKLSYQETFQNSVKPKCILSTGYGGGKTYALVMKAFRLMDMNQGLPGGILAPSLKQFKRDVLPTFHEICNESGLRYNSDWKYHRSDFYFSFAPTRSKIYVYHDNDEGDSIKGSNLAFGLINEVGLCSRGAFDAFLSRIRLKDAKLRQLAMSGTPEGFNWVYDYFIENPRADTEIIFGDMRENHHIASTYAQDLISSYDELMVKQYVEGQFINVLGRRAAWAFDRRVHVKDLGYDPAHSIEGQIWASVDFNVDPIVCTLWHRVFESKHLLRAFDEIVIPNSNTYELADEIIKRVGTGIRIYPDPTGTQRRTTAQMGVSDIQILKDKGFSEVLYKRKPPSVKDALNSINNLLSKGQILVSPKCKNLIADLEQCTIREGVFEIDKSNPKRSHSLDGAKIMADYEFPVLKSYSFVREQKFR